MINTFLQSFRDLDHHLIHEAVKITNGNEWLYVVVYLLAQVLIFVLPVILYILWRSRGHISKHLPQKAVVLAVLTVVLAFSVKTLFNAFYSRARPFITDPELMYMNFRVASDSFPSGHTIFAFAIASSLNLSGYHRLGSVLYVVAILIGLSRIFAGVHYPSDVLAGALIGMGSAWYLHREASTLKRYLPNR